MNISSTIPRTLTIRIAEEVTKKYPELRVAFLLARIDVHKATTEEKKHLSILKQRVISSMNGVTVNNYKDLPVCKSWRTVFGSFNVGNEKVSTIETLLRRAATESDKIKAAEQAGKKRPNPDFGNISNFVDLYNAISMETQTPMGALDLSKIDGEVELRYGREGETFTPLGRTEETFEVTPDHIVYADRSSVLTWLWNYRDGKHCCVPSEAKDAHIILFADEAERGAGDVVTAIAKAKEELTHIGGITLFDGVLSKDLPHVDVDISSI